MVTFSWKFVGFTVAPNVGELQDVITQIYWVYEGLDGEIAAFQEGYTDLDPVADPSTFVPYNQVTKEWTIAQVSAKHDVPAMSAELENRIAEMQAHQVVSLPPPFSE